ncbi:MAG: methyltransferase [Salinivirgaceae bacterium]
MLAFLIVALSATFVAASFIIIQTGRTGAAPVPSNRAMRSAMSKLLGEELDRAEADRTSAGAIRIVDLGSGWGGLTRMLAKAHPTAAFTGVELSIVPLICSRLALLASGPANANFERRNLHRTLDVWN